MPSSFSRPLTVGTLTAAARLSDQLKKAASPFVDIIELRLDTFHPCRGSAGAAQSARVLARFVKDRLKKPLLMTFRADSERGENIRADDRVSDRVRQAVLAAVLPWAAYLDIEARSSLAGPLTALARKKGVRVIHSFHNFKGPAPTALLNRLSKNARQLKADFFKAAITSRTEADLHRFLNWGLELREPRPILIAMGKRGLPSRYVGFSFGSVFSYGHLGKSAAPGQVPADELGKALRKIYG
jgi:3-dehydroquinate dehydratase I